LTAGGQSGTLARPAADNLLPAGQYPQYYTEIQVWRE